MVKVPVGILDALFELRLEAVCLLPFGCHCVVSSRIHQSTQTQIMDWIGKRSHAASVYWALTSAGKSEKLPFLCGGESGRPLAGLLSLSHRLRIQVGLDGQQLLVLVAYLVAVTEQCPLPAALSWMMTTE